MSFIQEPVEDSCSGWDVEDQEHKLDSKSDYSRTYTVGSKTVAMFEGLGLVAMQRLTAWKYHLSLVEWSKVLLLGFPTVLYS